MKIFIFGKSKTGKSTFAKKLVSHLGNENYIHVQASEFVKEKAKEVGLDSNSEKYREELTKLSTKLNRENQKVCVDYILSHYDLANKIGIIEGIRTPSDFIHLTSFVEDKYLFLNYKNLKTTVAASLMDDGVRIIRETIEFYNRLGIIPEKNITILSYETFEEFNSNFENILRNFLLTLG